VQPHFSPDGNKLAYMKRDPKTSQVDIWTYDLQSNQEKNVTHDDWPENAPIWSRDGKHVLYASNREQYASIYRKTWDGTGEEEMLFRYTPGAGIVLTDESPDGKFVTFFTGVLVLVPLGGTDPLARKPIEWLRDEYDNVAAKFSPDGRFVAYCTDPDDPMTLDVFVRPFDSSKPDAPPPGDPARISKGGVAAGMIAWRGDGKELYYMTRDFEMMAVDVSDRANLQGWRAEDVVQAAVAAARQSVAVEQCEPRRPEFRVLDASAALEAEESIARAANETPTGLWHPRLEADSEVHFDVQVKHVAVAAHGIRHGRVSDGRVVQTQPLGVHTNAAVFIGSS
jgi:protease II